ncbi:MAG: GDSL-type esterase/lipase family protein [Planctomycetota bacterium]|jgi:hypothetical protein
MSCNHLSKKCRLVILILLSVSCSIVNAVTIDPSDANIQYMGRWNFSNPSSPKIAWQGAAITVNFDGTGIKATIDADDFGGYSETFRVVIDDDYSATYTFDAGPDQTQYTLASGLTSTVHKLVLMKETYDGYNSVFYGFDVTGSGLVAPPPRPTRKLECFGDSNAAGANLASEDNSTGTGQYFTFPFIAARALGAEMHNLSTGGETISGSHAKYDRWDWYNEMPHWDFNLYTPDVVILNLGANDVGSPVIKIKNAYNSFLDDLRSTYPDAHICLMNGFGWGYDETANYTDDVVAARGDPNMSYLHFPWVFEQWHGSEYDHAGMARYLVEHLESVLGITAPNKPDVMDGFGRDGDIANGSFEEVAPFGGFGWRYSTLDSGINRIYDPCSAYDGDYHLRLNGGKNVHQPVPASDGDEFTVTLWAKGASAGDTLSVTMDFRDQEMWTAPLQTATETKTLKTDWQQYTMTATAPAGVPKPVYHTRLTLQAGSGDTVDIDYIRMSSPSYSYCADGSCDTADLAKMAENWLSNDPTTDLTGDAIVNFKDFDMLAQSWMPD